MLNHLFNRLGSTFPLVVLAVFAASLPAGASDGFVYYGTGTPGPEFGRIDPQTGAVTVISPSIDAGDDFHLENGRNAISADRQMSFVRGLAFNRTDGELYALIRNHCPCEFPTNAIDPETGLEVTVHPAGRGDPALLTLDIATGSTKRVIHPNAGAVIAGTTFDETSGMIYMTGTPFGNQMHVIDPAEGLATELPKLMNHFVYAIAIHPDTGLLYGIGKNAGRKSTQNLITINKETGQVDEVIKTDLGLPGTTPGPKGVSVQALTFLPDGKMLAAVKSDGGHPPIYDPGEETGGPPPPEIVGGNELWEISVTGDIRLITDDLGNTLNLDTGLNEVRLVNALEFFVPEPATGLLLVSLFGFACVRRRRHATQRTNLVRATNPADGFSLTATKRSDWTGLQTKFSYSATYSHPITGPGGV